MTRPPPRSTLFPYTTLFRSMQLLYIGKNHPVTKGMKVVTAGSAPGPLQSIYPRGIPIGEEPAVDRKSTRLNSSHLGISYAVFCLTQKKLHHDRSGARSVARL